MEDLADASRLAVRVNTPVVVLHGVVGAAARGVLYQPSAPAGPIMAEAVPFTWGSCAHCGRLLARAQLSASLHLILCTDSACGSRTGDLRPEAAPRTADLLAASQNAQQARFEPWREHNSAASA